MKNNNQERIYKMTSVVNVANRFIELSLNDNKPITNLKLQKLVYIAYAFMLKEVNRKLFYEDICAFEYGPVIPDLYNKLKVYGSNQISSQIFVDSNEQLPELNRIMVDIVYAVFKELSANELVYLTHMNNSAWKIVKDRCEGDLPLFCNISNEDILFSKEPAIDIINSKIG